MVLKKSKGYQDIEGSTSDNRIELQDPDVTVTQEIEMASMSVIPDGRHTIKSTCLLFIYHTKINIYYFLDTFTVTQAVNALGFGWFQVKLSLWTGLCWMADSMEMTILSILSPALHCHWHISR